MATHSSNRVQTQPEASLGLPSATTIEHTAEASTTLEAIEKLVNATVTTAEELPLNAPNAKQIKYIAGQ